MLRGPMSDPEYLQAIMPVKTFSILMGSLYNRQGDWHRVFRKHMAQQLSVQRLRESVPQFCIIFNHHVEQWVTAASVPGAHLRLDDLTRLLIAETAFSVVAGTKLPVKELGELVSMATTLQAGLFCVPIYFPGTTWYKAVNIRKPYLEILAALVTSRFMPATPGGPLRIESDTQAPQPMDTNRAMLEELADVGQPLTADVAALRCAQNLLGATETTAASTLALLIITSARPDVQQKLRAEQATLIKEKGRDITWEYMTPTCVPYLDACVKEVMRLAPSAHGLFRQALKDFEVGGYRIKKGTNVFVGLDLLTCMDVEQALKDKAPHWETDTGTDRVPPIAMSVMHLTEAFQPDRWLDQKKSRTLHAFAYGPHSCLGKEFAMFEMRLIVALLCRQCTWSLPDTPTPRLTMIPFTKLANGKPEFSLTLCPL